MEFSSLGTSTKLYCKVAIEYVITCLLINVCDIYTYNEVRFMSLNTVAITQMSKFRY